MAKSSAIENALLRMMTVSERATAYKMPLPNTAPTVGTELAVRPKVLRRPAHFSTKMPIDTPQPIFIPVQQQPTSEAKPAPLFRAWQDDGKFAITLLAIVILVNLVVSAWLSFISPTPAAKSSMAQTTPLDGASGAPVHVLDNNARDISEQ